MHNLIYKNMPLILFFNIIVLCVSGGFFFYIPFLMFDSIPDIFSITDILIGTFFSIPFLGFEILTMLMLLQQDGAKRDYIKKITIQYSILGLGPLIIVSIMQLVEPATFFVFILLVAEAWGSIFFISAFLVAISFVLRKQSVKSQ